MCSSDLGKSSHSAGSTPQGFLNRYDLLIMVRIAEVLSSLFSIRAFTNCETHNGMSISMQIFNIVSHLGESSFSAGFTPQGLLDQHDPLILFRKLKVIFLFDFTVPESKISLFKGVCFLLLGLNLFYLVYRMIAWELTADFNGIL